MRPRCTTIERYGWCSCCTRFVAGRRSIQYFCITLQALTPMEPARLMGLMEHCWASEGSALPAPPQQAQRGPTHLLVEQAPLRGVAALRTLLGGDEGAVLWASGTRWGGSGQRGVGWGGTAGRLVRCKDARAGLPRGRPWPCCLAGASLGAGLWLHTCVRGKELEHCF